MTRPDYRALGFTLSAHDALPVLGLTAVREVYDHIRAGTLIALYDFGEGRKTPTFHPEELTDLRQRIVEEKLTAAQRLMLRSQRILHDYLADRPPVGDYDEASECGTALLAGSTSGVIDTYVRAETVVEWFNERRDVSIDAPITKTTITDMLEKIGAVQRRGFVALVDRGTDTQRWARWWRLPRSFVDDTPPGFTRFEEGDKLSHRGGNTTLVPPLGNR